MRTQKSQWLQLRQSGTPQEVVVEWTYIHTPIQVKCV